ncbi:MAG TPA: GlsB/YeaQ/YmgE family stress response membrane protein [Thermomicrobiales bacterium]|nr:GlsB/YeaQ/YmgE family stress response membrane protein [Thermomicrobiales bacterium]
MVGLIIGWIIIGAIAGLIASLIVPGNTPGGWIGGIIIGIIGGLIGGWIFSLFTGGGLTFIGTVIVAIIAAVVILYAMRAMSNRSTV